MNMQWINRMIPIALLCLLNMGCTSSLKQVTNKDAPTMKQVYKQYTGAGDDTKTAERHIELLRRPAIAEDNLQLGLPPYPERLDHLYPRLPNPDLFMYVRPHAVGQTGAPIPAYITRFTMYERQPYALPGETLQAAKIENDYRAQVIEENKRAAEELAKREREKTQRNMRPAR